MFLNLDAELAATIRALMNAAVAAPAAVDTTLPGYAAAASHGAARHARSPAYSRIGGKPGWRLAGRP
jgi:hypothetical protein